MTEMRELGFELVKTIARFARIETRLLASIC